MCAAGTNSKDKYSTKSKPWNLLGLTAFGGRPVMCIVIFAGIKRVPLYETGMHQFVDINSLVSENDFFDKTGDKEIFTLVVIYVRLME